eukprot:COSAG01_NODE_3402_length_6135_cov_21.923956_10_plen_45_part_00
MGPQTRRLLPHLATLHGLRPKVTILELAGLVGFVLIRAKMMNPR